MSRSIIHHKQAVLVLFSRSEKMGQEKHEHAPRYRSMPHKSRFWFHAEQCYTEAELTFREWVLNIRLNSGIHPDYLANPSSWFGEKEQALINVYENAWFYSNAFRTRQILSRDDFHVQPIDSQRLQWPALYNLMQNVGDYLLIRNELLPAVHLNHPMNFVLLDLNLMLKGLSQNTNINQVQEQLELITRYLRTIEKNISPLVGSDRLFLSNFRNTIDEQIHPQLTHKIESQLLKERLNDLSKTIKQLSTDRNRILHFALNINKVNPHPYDFSINKIDDVKHYPTQAARECGQETTELVHHEPIALLQLTMSQLKDCPNFKLISMSEEIVDHYAKAISHLNELARFQLVINQIMDLLSQAGEVYTIYQFKEQMLHLLKEIDGFIDDSSLHIDAIVQANTRAYHQAIQDEQNLSLLQKLLTSEKEKLQTFIKNQDTLAQFPSSLNDLHKTNKLLKSQVIEVSNHLSASKVETSFDSLAGQAKELDLLMNSMHNWIKIQYEMKGLSAPNPPERLVFKTPQEPSSPIPSPNLEPPKPTISSYVINNNQCHFRPNHVTNNTHALLSIGLLVAIPLILIGLYLLMQSRTKPIATNMTSKQRFNELIIEAEDIITLIRGFEIKNFCTLDYESFINRYKEIKEQGAKNNYSIDDLMELVDDLKAFYKSCYQSYSSEQLAM